MAMNKNQSVVIELSSKDGLFSVDKRITLFRQHTTKTELVDLIPAILKEIKSMLKKSGNRVSIDILFMNENYKRSDEMRYLITTGWTHPSLDTRRFNGRDYGDSEVVTYEKESFLFKVFNKDFERVVKYILGELPQDRSLYGQECDKEYPVSESVES